jgi:hypothetical protein
MTKRAKHSRRESIAALKAECLKWRQIVMVLLERNGSPVVVSAAEVNRQAERGVKLRAIFTDEGAHVQLEGGSVLVLSGSVH